MTPYRERRAQGLYNEKGEVPESTTTDNLAGLGAPQLEPEPADEETEENE